MDKGIPQLAYVDVIVSTIGAIAVAYSCFSIAVMLTLRRCYIYLGSLIFSSVLIRIWLHFASIVFGGYTAFWEIKLYLLAIIYIVGVVVYSQVMIEQADQFRDIDYVDHVLDISVYFAGILIVIVLMLLRKASKYGKGKKKKLN
ncbi:unnamed protein product [Ilex paraguariensis]|uniref:Uncharacterized protein n=1 Tax=Ilex paraguariensis TaxID=185542 RepID=A0ABC8S4Y5_9AQUA